MLAYDIVRWVRWAAIVLLVIALGLVSVWAWGERSKRADWSERFLANKGQLTGVNVTFVEDDENGNTLHGILLENDGRIRVRASLRVPNSEGPHPVLLLLGGLRSGKETLAYVGPSHDVILVAIDYPYEGKRSRLTTWETLSSLPAMRRAIVDTPPAVMLVIDYLLGRDDVDPDRLVLVGGSFGALFGPAATLDERIAATALLLGGADLETLGRAHMRRVPPTLRPLALWILSVLAAPVEPAKYVGDIAPRPLLMINATEDPAIPLHNAEILHESAREPKTVIWIPAGHVTIYDPEFAHLVIEQLVAWLDDQGFIPRQAGLGIRG